MVFKSLLELVAEIRKSSMGSYVSCLVIHFHFILCFQHFHKPEAGVTSCFMVVLNGKTVTEYLKNFLGFDMPGINKLSINENLPILLPFLPVFKSTTQRHRLSLKPVYKSTHQYVSLHSVYRCRHGKIHIFFLAHQEKGCTSFINLKHFEYGVTQGVASNDVATLEFFFCILLLLFKKNVVEYFLKYIIYLFFIFYQLLNHIAGNRTVGIILIKILHGAVDNFTNSREPISSSNSSSSLMPMQYLK